MWATTHIKGTKNLDHTQCLPEAGRRLAQQQTASTSHTVNLAAPTFERILLLSASRLSLRATPAIPPSANLLCVSHLASCFRVSPMTSRPQPLPSSSPPCTPAYAARPMSIRNYNPAQQSMPLGRFPNCRLILRFRFKAVARIGVLSWAQSIGRVARLT